MPELLRDILGSLQEGSYFGSTSGVPAFWKPPYIVDDSNLWLGVRIPCWSFPILEND